MFLELTICLPAVFLRHRRHHRAPLSVSVAVIVAIAANLYNWRGGGEVAIDAIVAVAAAIVFVVVVVALTVAAIVAVAFVVVVAFVIVVAIAVAAIIAAAAVAISIVTAVPIVIVVAAKLYNRGGTEAAVIAIVAITASLGK